MKRMLAVLLAVVTVVALLVPMTSAKKATNEKQEAVMRTALAYYYRGYGVQYDSNPITAYGKYDGGPIRGGYTFSPEDATDDNICFSVCSDYMMQIYYDAFDWMLMDSVLATKCNNMMALAHAEGDNPLIAYYYSPFKSSDVAKRSKDITPEQAAEELKGLLQPGDVMVVMNKDGDTGHAMLYGGDLFNDGNDYMIHCYGGKYEPSTGANKIETKEKYPTGFGGAIRADKVQDYIFNTNNNNYSIPSGKWEVIILRPLNVLQSTPLTASAKGRLQYDKLDICRVSDHTRYKDVELGGDVTVNLTLTNHSAAAYTVPVTQIVPANSTLKKAEGAKVDGSTLTWSVALEPEKPVTLTYTVTATGKRGDIIDLTGGNVGGIKDNDIPVTIGGKRLTAEQEKTLENLADHRAELDKLDLNSAKMVNYVYQNYLGLNVELPSLSKLEKQFTETKRFPSIGNLELPKDKVEGEYALYGAMRIPHYYGGYYVITDDSRDRALTFETQHLYPGDVVLYTSSSEKTNAACLYLGNGKAAIMKDKTLSIVDAYKQLSLNLTYDYFIGLRPTLAYDDINAEAKYVPTVKLPFTDVKEGDWYYEFVKELYEKKIVSGMTETTFVPNGKLTYGQALKLIVVGLGNPEQASTGGNWASGYLKFAKDQKWLDKDVDLNGAISRLQFCQIAAKAKNLTAQPASNPFKDCADKDVLALVNAGIINGMSADTFAPDNTLTRAQISKIISGLIK